MKITERFRAAVQALNTTNNSMGAELARDFLKHGNRNNPIYPDWSQVLMSDKDLYTGYSYAAINNRANLAAQLADNNLKTKAKQAIVDAAKAKDEVVEHPYLGFVDTSKTFSNYKFWYDISTFLDLEGVYYLFVLRNKSGDRVGNVQYFKLLNPFDITRVLNIETLEVDSYMETRAGMIRNIPPEMIIEIRKLNPFSYEHPFAMTDAAKDAQYTLKQAGDQMRNTIARNNKFPGVALVGDSDVAGDPQQLENFKARMLGRDKRGEPVFVTGQGALNWQDMQVDLGKSKHDVVNEINLNALIAVTGNSKTMFGIEQSGVTRDTAEVQKDLFIQNHGMPQLQLIIDALNQDYKTNYEAEYQKTGYRITIDNPLASDKAAEKTDTEIRKNEYDLYVSLVSKGYERDIAAKYAEGRVTLEEIGEPSNEPVAISNNEQQTTNKLDHFYDNKGGGNPNHDGLGRFSTGGSSSVYETDDNRQALTKLSQRKVVTAAERTVYKNQLYKLRKKTMIDDVGKDAYYENIKLMAAWNHDSRHVAGKMARANKKALNGEKSLMTAEYDFAQAYYKNSGVKEVTLYRGISGKSGKQMLGAVSSKESFALRPDYASSWSDDVGMAHWFATQHKNGLIVKKTFNVKDIATSYRTNPILTKGNENEFIVMDEVGAQFNSTSRNMYRVGTKKDKSDYVTMVEQK